MSSDRERFERDVVEIVQRVLRGLDGDLLAHGLTVDVQGPLVFQSDPARYGSEIEIQLKRRANIVDVLEFPLFRDGRQSASLDEVEDWLQKNMQEAIEAIALKHS